MKLAEIVAEFAIPHKIRELPKNWSTGLLGNEKEAIIKTTYQVIEMSFLDIAGQDCFFGLYMPQFACYQYRGDCFGDCEITISTADGCCRGFDENNPRGVDSIVTRPLTGGHRRIIWEQLKKIASSVSLNRSGWKNREAASEMINKLFGGQKTIRVASRFVGVLPSRIKERLPSDKVIFDDLYLIAEGQWQQEKITADPLLIGRYQDTFYLLDFFDTTLPEDYIRKEFTSNV